MISKSHARKLLEIKLLHNSLYGRLSQRRNQEPILVGGKKVLKPALRLMTWYRLKIEEVLDGRVTAFIFVIKTQAASKGKTAC